MILSKEKQNKIDLELLANEKIHSGSLEQLLIIVPTNRKARSLKKDIVSISSNKSAFNINVETLETLSSKILEQYKPYRKLSEASSIIFLKQSFSEVKLRYLSVYKNEIPFGTLERIKNVISEYKRHGITSDNLRENSKKLEDSERNKALDIADIYDAYTKKCFVLNAYELGDIYSLLSALSENSFQEIFAQIYPSVDLTIVNGFDEFTSLEIQILNKISNVSNNKFFINFDYDVNNTPLFEHLDKCFNILKELGFEKIEDVNERHLTTFKKTIKEKLFSEKRNIKEGRVDKIYKYSAFNKESETEFISKEIKRLIVEQNVEPHKICTAFNQIQNYSQIVRDVFSKNGIPFNLTDRLRLDNSFPIIAIVNYLEIVENDYYYKNIFRALGSSFIDSYGIDYSNLFAVSSQLKIISGRQNWILHLQESIDNLLNITDDDEDEKVKKETMYKKALDDIKAIEELLKPFEVNQTINDFRKNLHLFIKNSKLPIKILQIEYRREENVRALAKFLDTVDEVFSLLMEEYGENKKFGLKFFMDQIRTICNWARFNTKEKSNFGIQVTSLDEIRGLNFDYLFIGGLCDGELPTRYKPEIFFSGNYKKSMQTHLLEERYRFYQSLCTWKKNLYLSHPLTDKEKENVESSFLHDLTDLFDVESIQKENETNIICSKEDVEILYGYERNNKIFKQDDSIKSKAIIDIDKINKSITVELIREINPLEETEYNGFILSNYFDELSPSENKLIEKLSSFSKNQYSISQLEMYALCPYRFFVERILGLAAIEEPTEEIEAIEMGRILHSIFFEFYMKLRELKINLQDCSSDDLQKARTIIFKIAEDKVTTTHFKSPVTFYEREKLFGFEGNKEDSILNKFIENETQKNDFIPSYFEVNFGNVKKEGADNLLSDSEPVYVGNVRLRGKIDRIDISSDERTFNIVDYKLSGKKPTFKQLKEGISLQLPVYLLAAAALLKKKYNKNFIPNDMIIYSLKYAKSDFGKDKVSMGKGEVKTIPGQLIQQTLNHIEKYISNIIKGNFGLSPHNDREQLVCCYCSFINVCRIKN